MDRVAGRRRRTRRRRVLSVEGLTVAAIAGAASAGATAWLRRHPAALDVLDRPDGRKPHREPVPAIGGIGVVLGVAIAWAAAGADQPAVLPAGLLVLLAAGLLDDHRGLSARTRFTVQAAVALLFAVGGGMVLHDFGALLTPGVPLAAGLLALPLTVFCAVGLVNATNMIDGCDGLAGSLALASLAGVALLAAGADAGHALLPWLGGVAAALAAFLAFNLRLGGRPARVFLGNGGSMALGALLAWLAITLSQGPDRLFAPATALWLFAVPLVDTVSVMWRRIAARRSPFDADHQHVHHLLLRAGCGVNGTLGVLLALHATCVATGVAMAWGGVPERTSAACFLLVALLLHAAKVRAARRLPPLPGDALH